MNRVMEVPGSEFEHAVLPADLPVLAVFDTSWCRQTQILAPSLPMHVGELEGEGRVVRVGPGGCPELAERYGLIAAPTLVLFYHGVPLHSFERMPPVQELKARSQDVLADYAIPNAA